MTVGGIFVLVAALAQAQSDLPREVLDLSRIRTKMREDLQRLPHYTCLESIERSHRAAGKSDFQPVDRLRIEVTHIGKDEMYSWPGAKRFESSVRDVVPTGTISSGEFLAHAFNIFGNSATQIHYAGLDGYEGRAALKYDYRVAAFASGWTLRFGAQSAMVAEYGSFWADRQTLEVLRVESRADQIPADLGITAVTSDIDYGKVRIGDGDVFLPQSARVLAAGRGGESLNEIEFSQCRAYLTESSIRFDGAPDVESPPAPAMQDAALPAGVTISMELTQPIDSSAATEGDTVTARITADAKLKNRVIVPKDATVHGRIRRLERHEEPVAHFIVSLEFVEIDAGGKRWVFRGSLEQIDPVAGLSWTLSAGTSREVKPNLSEPGGMLQSLWSVYKEQSVYTGEVPGAGTFFMEGAHFRLPQGLRMRWRTSAER